MPSIVDSLSLISQTVDSLLDFLANDEILSKDFQEYLELNNIELNSEAEFNNVVMQYLLDAKMQNGLRVLEYYRRNNNSYDEIIKSLQNSFCSIFKVQKILSNAFEVECLTSNAQLTLIPMVKMSHLKKIGRYDYIEARILELNDTQYILEIYDIISEFNTYKATLNALRYMIQAPSCAYYKNPEKFSQLKNSVSDFQNKFEEYFHSSFVVTTNKKVDSLIEAYSKFRQNQETIDYSNLIEKIEENKYFKIEELENETSSFLENAIGGFSSHKEIYDVALWMDKKRGLYIIPFFETFVKSFSEDIEGKADCIKEFLTSDKIPPSVIKYVQENNENFFDVVNEVLKTKFSTLEEILFNTKSAFIEDGVFSPVVILYNSELFSSLIDYDNKEEQTKTTEKIGRNDPCPCGSGLKYKNCCEKRQ